MSLIVLKKGSLSPALRKRFGDYYAKIEGIDPAYTATRWQQWEKDPDIAVYSGKRGRTIVGWIVYSPQRSTIEEILVNGEEQQTEVLFQMIDALTVEQSLLAAELLNEDKERYRWMEAYGFRPTRNYSAYGVSLRKMDLSTVVFFQRLKEHRPVKRYTKKERVVIERVAETQTQEEIGAAVDGLIAKLGGLDRFVKPGQTVVIKPNVVADHGMLNGRYVGGVVTDKRLLKALIELLLPVAGKIVVAEGASINRSATDKLFALYGYDELVDIDPAKVSLVDLNADEVVEKPVPGGKRMMFRKVPRTLHEADAILSVPVMKLHFAAGASLAVKMLQGAMPPLEKYMSHFFGLWQSLVNIHHLIKPNLTIIDGLTGQEDFGPVSGIPKKMDLLVGGINPVAIDAVTMRIMGMDPRTSPPVLLAYLQGLGPIESEMIDVVGASIEEVASPFRQPEINLASGRDFSVNPADACSGCRGYLHFVLNKLRRSDPQDPTRLLIDRPFDPKVNIFLGPKTERPIDPKATNIFMGICQQHHAAEGTHLAGCPPHAEVIMNGLFRLFPDVERPKYANDTEEAKLERMLKEVLATL
jgi:uncharacterized protein (DUF362 family)